MKTKAVLQISVIYEDFSLTPEELRAVVSQNITRAVNRGLLTEGLDSTVAEWSVNFDFKPQNLTMPTQIYLKAIYEGDGDESEGIKATLQYLAEYLASRGELSDDRVPVAEWDSQVSVQKVV
jgi:hypothetical protein